MYASLADAEDIMVLTAKLVTASLITDLLIIILFAFV
jgi:hypothetical protein